MKPRVEVFRGISGNWYFRIVAANHRIVAQSEGYVKKSGCLQGVEAVRRALATAAVVIE
jgi:uncharacterized protein YegP (UPF0339 family)